MAEILKDSSGNKIGEIKSQGGRMVLYDKGGNKLGSYNPDNNTTYDRNGNKYGSGNLLTSLIR